MSKAIMAVLACAICMSMGLGPLFIGTLPVFLMPVSHDLGWGAAVFPQAALLAGLAGALVGPLLGRLMDSFGVRPVLLVGLVVWAGTLLWMSYIGGTRIELWCVATIMGVGAASCGPIGLAKVVSGWFDRQRGVVLGIVLSAAPAIATAAMIVAVHWLIGTYGWRIAYRVLAALVVSFGIPIALLFIRESESVVSAAPVDDKRGKEGVLRVLWKGDFWLVMLVTGLICGVANALVSQFVAFSAERGISDATATAALSAYSLFAPVGAVLAGMLADRVSGPKPLALFYGLPLLGVTLLVTWGASTVIPAMILLGMGFSAATGMLPYLLTRYFGIGYASQLFGVGLGIVTLSMGVGAVMLGLVHDRLQTFAAAVPVLILLLVGATAISLMLGQYGSAARK